MWSRWYLEASCSPWWCVHWRMRERLARRRHFNADKELIQKGSTRNSRWRPLFFFLRHVIRVLARAGDAVKGSLLHPARKQSCSSARMTSPLLERGLPFSPPPPLAHLSSALLFIFSFLPPFVLPVSLPRKSHLCLSLSNCFFSPQDITVLIFHILLSVCHFLPHLFPLFFLLLLSLSQSLWFSNICSCVPRPPLLTHVHA